MVLAMFVCRDGNVSFMMVVVRGTSSSILLEAISFALSTTGS